MSFRIEEKLYIDKNQIVKNSVVAGPITINATITVEGNLVVV